MVLRKENFVQKRDLLKTVTRIVVPSVFGFMLGTGVRGIVQNQPYSVIKTTVAVSGLGLYYSRRFEPNYKKTKRALDKMFRNALVSRSGVAWPVGVVFKEGRILKEFGQFSFSMLEMGDYIYENMKIFLDDALGYALIVNRQEGLGIKDSVLRGFDFAVNRHVPAFKEKRTITAYVKSYEIMELFALCFSQRVFERVQQAKCDEDVLDFFNTGFQDRSSLFYGLEAKELTGLFFNRKPYQKGNEVLFKSMTAGCYASLVGLVASSCFLPSAASLGMATIVGGVLYSDYLLRQKYFLIEQARFLNQNVKLKSIEPIQMIKSFLPNMICWEQKETFLTSYGETDLNLKVLKNVIKCIQNMPFSLSSEVAGEYLKMVLVDGNKNLSRCYKGLYNGLTLEGMCEKFGVAPVYEMMRTMTYVQKLKTEKNKTKECILFELKSSLAEAEMELEKSKEEPDSRGFVPSVDEMNAFFEDVLGVKSELDFNDSSLILYKQLCVSEFVNECAKVRLPKVIRRLQKEANIRVKS